MSNQRRAILLAKSRRQERKESGPSNQDFKLIHGVAITEGETKFSPAAVTTVTV